MCILDVTKHKSDFFSFFYFTFSITCVYTCANVIPRHACVNQRTTYGKWFSPSMSVPGIELRLGGIQLYQLSHLARPNMNFSERKNALVWPHGGRVMCSLVAGPEVGAGRYKWETKGVFPSLGSSWKESGACAGLGPSEGCRAGGRRLSLTLLPSKSKALNPCPQTTH